MILGIHQPKKVHPKVVQQKPDGSSSSEAVSAFCAASSPPSDAAGGDAAKTAARLSMVAVLSPALKQREGSMRSGKRQLNKDAPGIQTHIHTDSIYIYTHHIQVVICRFYI